MRRPQSGYVATDVPNSLYAHFAPLIFRNYLSVIISDCMFYGTPRALRVIGNFYRGMM